MECSLCDHRDWTAEKHRRFGRLGAPLHSPADLRDGASQLSIAMIIEATSVGGLFQPRPCRAALLNLLDTIASDAAIFGGLVNYASVSCKVQGTYSPAHLFSVGRTKRETSPGTVLSGRGFF